MDQREWIVQLVVSATHEYTVVARTEQDAISQAEGMYEDGDGGTKLGWDVETADAFPEGSEEEEEEGYE